MAAIQYLNSYYVGRQLDHESEFVSQCMAHLAAATADLAESEESSLLCIQRALLLLKTHLETFRKRYGSVTPNITDEWLTLLLHIMEVLGSNFVI
jgi:ubiquitin carboxyl-terminal hydrolase 34